MSLSCIWRLRGHLLKSHLSRYDSFRGPWLGHPYCLQRPTGATVSGGKGLGREQLTITVVCSGEGWRLDKAPTVNQRTQGSRWLSCSPP